MTMHIKSCDFITIRTGSEQVLPPLNPPAALHVGDHIQITLIDEIGEFGWQGVVTELFRGDRVKIELITADGETCRYSVPRDLLQLVRGANA